MEGEFHKSLHKINSLFDYNQVRIYHNVTRNETEAWDTFCSLYCQFDFIDFCDTRALPTLGDLNTRFPIGRFWRFQVLSDPTVSVFGSRDVDSYLTEREAAAVRAWLVSGKQWHVMRDGPFHRSVTDSYSVSTYLRSLSQIDSPCWTLGRR